MNFKNKILVLGALLVLNVFPVFTTTVYATPATKTISDSAIENAVLVHINEYRKQRHLPPLTMDQNITREARQHSMDMATHRMPFGHKDFLKRINHLHAKIKNSGAGGENVAYNYKDARTVVQQWVLSPGHKRNIVGNYNLTGIGVARDKQGKIYYTQIFIRQSKNQPVKVARRPPFSFSFSGISFRRNS